MATSDERRRAAEDLRGLCDYHIRYAEQFYEELTEIVTLVLDVTFEGVANSLADLIDPTCRMRPVLEGFRCSACGTYHDMSGFEEFPWPRCPECGARVVRGDE